MVTALLCYLVATAVSGTCLAVIVCVQWALARLRPEPARRRGATPAAASFAAAARRADAGTTAPAGVHRAA